MLVRLLVKVDMFSVFPYYGLAKIKKIFFDIKCHDSYLKGKFTLFLNVFIIAPTVW